MTTSELSFQLFVEVVVLMMAVFTPQLEYSMGVTAGTILWSYRSPENIEAIHTGAQRSVHKANNINT
jgi:hypothetical protein